MFESLNSRTIRTVLDAFQTLQSNSDAEPFKKTKTDAADSELDSMTANFGSGPRLDSNACPLLGLSDSSSKDNFSEFFGSVEGKSPDRSSSPLVNKKCDILMAEAGGAVASAADRTFAEGVSRTAVAERSESKSERETKEELLEVVRTLWSRPVAIDLTQIQSVLRSLSADPDSAYSRDTDTAHSSAQTRTQTRGKPTATFLRELIRTSSSANANVRAVHGADGETLPKSFTTHIKQMSILLPEPKSISDIMKIIYAYYLTFKTFFSNSHFFYHLLRSRVAL